MSSSADEQGLLSIQDVSRQFDPRITTGDRIAAKLGARVEIRSVKAVDDVSLKIMPGETLGLVGESGCGKSTLGRMAAGILQPTSGRIVFDGKPVIEGGRKTTTKIQTVFQDPFASLDPRMKVGKAVAEGPVAHDLVSPSDARSYVADWFVQVGLDEDFMDRYPHQFSGGQRQRVAIARALAMQPALLICDEPVASLDVSIQAQIINLLLDLRSRLQLTCLFISHDLSVVRHLSDRLAVMYLGRVVEQGAAADVFDAPAHPYTQGLLDSVPRILPGDDKGVSETIRGELPSPLSPPPGCHFAPRCKWVQAQCSTVTPELRTFKDDRSADIAVAQSDNVAKKSQTRHVMCHLAEEVFLQSGLHLGHPMSKRR